MTGTRKTAGVIGWPIEHSLSPVLHGYWLREYGIDGEMVRLAAKPEDFAATIARVRSEGFAGVNVTVPHKEAAFALADRRDAAAQVAGAANLLVFDGDEIRARNTDSFGLGASIAEALGPRALDGKNAVLLGAGGAARAVPLALAPLGISRLHILNRTVERARALTAYLAKSVAMDLVPGSFADWPAAAEDAALLINTTSAGMKGAERLDLDLAPLPRGAAVCDIVYNPLQTDLLKAAKALGYKTIDGLGMLMHQAVPSFEAFFGVTPKVTPGLWAALEQVLRERS